MSIKLKGSTDGSVTLQAPADTSPTGTDKTLTLPTTVGSAEQFVKNGGTAGELEFSSMVETSTGVGIGTSAPSKDLQVSGATAPTIRIDNTDTSLTAGQVIGSLEYQANDSSASGTGTAASISTIATSSFGQGGALVFSTRTESDADAVEQCRINQNGNLGVGSNNPSAKIEIGGIPNSGSANELFTIDRVDGTQLYSINYNQTTNTVEFQGNNKFFAFQNGASQAERMRLTTDGAVRIGMTDFGNDVSATNPGLQLFNTNAGAINSSAASTTNSDHALFFNPNGIVGRIRTSGSATAYLTSSDYRLKENVVDLNGAITRVKQLAPKRFNFIADADTTVDGFLAHEAQTVVPEAVTGTHNEVDDDGNAVMQGIDQAKLVPLLTAALQEAISKIETLEAKVAALEAAE